MSSKKPPQSTYARLIPTEELFYLKVERLKAYFGSTRKAAKFVGIPRSTYDTYLSRRYFPTRRRLTIIDAAYHLITQYSHHYENIEDHTQKATIEQPAIITPVEKPSGTADQG